VKGSNFDSENDPKERIETSVDHFEARSKRKVGEWTIAPSM
jgi:hypothetical protein